MSEEEQPFRVGRDSIPLITLAHGLGLRDVGTLLLLEQVVGGTRPHFWTGWLEIQCANLPEPDGLLQYELVPGLVEFEVAVPRLKPASW